MKTILGTFSNATLLTAAIFALDMNVGAVNADEPIGKLPNNVVWTIDALMSRGENVYVANCAACHQMNGKGIPGAFPSLDGSSIVNGPKSDEIQLLLAGSTGNQVMPPWKDVLTDDDIAAVITYGRNSWSNRGRVRDNIVLPAEVHALRK